VQNNNLPRHQLLKCKCEAAGWQQDALTHVIDNLARNDNASFMHDQHNRANEESTKERLWQRIQPEHRSQYCSDPPKLDERKPWLKPVRVRTIPALNQRTPDSERSDLTDDWPFFCTGQATQTNNNHEVKWQQRQMCENRQAKNVADSDKLAAKRDQVF